MAQSFDEWSENQIIMVKSEAKAAFEAGAASRQAEIDELQKKLKLSESLQDGQFKYLMQITEQRALAQANNQELQNRIDKALEFAEKCTWNIALDELKRILKGETK